MLTFGKKEKDMEEEIESVAPVQQNMEEIVEEQERPYVFRKLNATDTFLMCKIIGKIGLAEIANCFSQDETKKIMVAFDAETKMDDNAIASVGISIAIRVAGKIIENLPKCEEEIFSMLSNVSDLDVKVIKNYDMEVFVQMIVDFIRKEEFKNFMKVASKLLK